MTYSTPTYPGVDLVRGRHPLVRVSARSALLQHGKVPLEGARDLGAKDSKISVTLITSQSFLGRQVHIQGQTVHELQIATFGIYIYYILYYIYYIIYIRW